jgi:pimeloyl-ACP methyl ester carboxylesterase
MPTITSHNVYYKTIGEGKPLVTISGIPSDHRIIASWLEPIFAQRPGWQRVYFDLPGTGQTPGESIAHIDQILDIVCDFIEMLLPQRQFSLLGLSVGGYLARGVIQRKSERVDGLCLLVPWLAEHDDAELPAPVIFSRDPQTMSQLPSAEAENLEGLAVIQNKKIVDWYRNVVMPARSKENKSFIEHRTFSFDPAQIFERPTLILTGKQDTHVGYQDSVEILKYYPRATLAVLDRAGHALGVEQENLFHALLNEWLDRVEASQANS